MKRKPLSKKIIGAIIGAILTATLTVYKVVSPDVHERCERWEGEYPVGICFLEHNSKKSDDIIVFNPGTLGKETFLESIGAENHEKFIKEMGEDLPKIITFTIYPSNEEQIENTLDEEKYGTLSLYNEKRLNHLRNVVLPRLWSNYLEGPFGRRFLMGTSRGGWNALQELKLSRQGRYSWDGGVILTSPLLTTCDPYQKLEANPWKLTLGILTQNWVMVALSFDQHPCINALRHKGKHMHGLGTLKMFQANYKDKKEFDLADPLKFNWRDIDPHRFYVQSTPEDDFPFFDADLKLHEILQSNSQNSRFVQTKGVHGAFDVVEMKKFILEK